MNILNRDSSGMSEDVCDLNRCDYHFCHLCLSPPTTLMTIHTNSGWGRIIKEHILFDVFAIHNINNGTIDNQLQIHDPFVRFKF